MKRIGIFGGSFNPVHNGHVALAKWLHECGYLDEVWLMLSPQNPLKTEYLGATDNQRCEMLRLACDGIDGLCPCFVEFDMPRPSYTIDTLNRLASTYSDCRFSLIIGSDNWRIFNKWRCPEQILKHFGVIVYPRPGYPVDKDETDDIIFVGDAPIFAVSSTEVRENIQDNITMLPDKVAKYIIDNSLYGAIKK